MDYKTITLQEVKDWLANNGSATMPLEEILLQLATGETDIDEFRGWVMKGRNVLN